MANKPTRLLLPGETTTANFGWLKPSVGGSGDAWGGEWNTNLDAIDSTVAAVPRVNRLDNGDMWVDQHNLGASVAIPANGAVWACDRWGISNTKAKLTVGQNYNGYTRVAGFPFYLGVQTTGTTSAAAAADASVVYQSIEADTIGDLAFGTAGAQPITLSFWVISSITGTFGASIYSAGTLYRFYPFTYTISAANTWTKIIVTIPGDTGGTTTNWPNAGNGAGMALAFDLGSGANSLTGTSGWQASSTTFLPSGTTAKIVATNGNKWGVTGVKLEAGSVATPYPYEPLSIKLARCQRYFQLWDSLGAGGYGPAGSTLYNVFPFFVKMRSQPATPALFNIAYTNSSGLTPQLLGVSSFYVTYAVTATGVGIVTFAASISADI